MIEVGQKLWYVPSSRHGEPREVTVESIGRKWAQIGHGRRINIKTLVVDGGQYSSPGTCYLSKQAYDDDQVLHEAWFDFHRSLRSEYSLPEGVTLEKIKQVKELLLGAGEK